MVNCLLYFDSLSENISLHYKNKTSHKNLVGGLVTILIYTLSVILSAYFSMELFERKDPKAAVVYKYTENAGKHSLNASGISHYFYILSSKNNSIIDIDPKAVTIRGEISTGITFESKGTYLYDKCDFELDFKGIEYLFTEIRTKEEILKSVCPRVYISPEGKQFKKNDPGYIDPFIDYGMNSIKNYPHYYQFTMKKCTNSNCYPLDQIHDYYRDSFFVFKFIDNFFDVTDYDHPVQKYINGINGVLNTEMIGNNFLNFLSVNVTTQDGLIFDHTYVEESFRFDDRVESLNPVNPNNIEILNIYVFLQNMSQFYTRSYAKLQDIFAVIGGAVKFLTVVGYFINFLFDRFQRYLDWILFFEKLMKFEKNVSTESKIQIIPFKSPIKTDLSSNVNIHRQKDVLSIPKIQRERLPLTFTNFYCKKLVKKEYFVDEIKKCVEIMLDENNLFKLYFEIIKIKKTILDDSNKNQLYDNLNVTFSDIINSDVHREETKY